MSRKSTAKSTSKPPTKPAAKKTVKLKAAKKSSSVTDIDLQIAKSKVVLKEAMSTITAEDRLLYLQRIFLGGDAMKEGDREKSLSAFLKFASIGFLTEALLRN